MITILRTLQSNWVGLVVPFGVFVAALATGYFVRRAVFGFLHRWSARTKSAVDDIVVEAIRGPFMVWVLMIALHLATQVSQLPPRWAGYLGTLLLALWILSFTIVGARLAARIVRVYGNHLQSTLPITSLTENIARIVVIIAGMLTLLRTLGIEVTPILTALGVGGLAVALALQDTLANFFAGFYISVANQIRTGDYIKLDSGEEGYVTDINWRNTTVRTLPNNLIIVPNGKLAQAIVTNFHLPEPRMSVQVPVSVSYDSDPDEIEDMLVEEARNGVGEIPGLLVEPQPFVRFNPGFGASSLDFTLVCQVAQFTDQYAVQHELRKRIFRRFRDAGVEIPYPISTVYLRGRRAESRLSPMSPHASARH